MVCGDYGIGGLAGTHEGSIANSYSIGIVKVRETGGGLVGYWTSSNAVILDSYNATITGGYGLVRSGDYRGIASNSFWDIDVSGVNTSDGGTGLTTLEMKDQQTFLDAGWDFVGESDNGVQDIWVMHEDAYPTLTWQGNANLSSEK